MTTPDNKVFSVHIRQIDRKEEPTRLTREALGDADRGRVIDHQAVINWAKSLSADRPLSVPK